MKLKSKVFVFLILSLVHFCFTRISAQEVLPSAGGYADGLDGNFSYSVGQVFTKTYTDIDGSSISEGIQQVYEVSTVSVYDAVSSHKIELTVFPNPVADWLIVDAELELNSVLLYQLIDIQGKIIEENKIKSNEMKINMKHKKPGTYFLRIYNDQGGITPVLKISRLNPGQTIKTFKIIKK